MFRGLDPTRLLAVAAAAFTVGLLLGATFTPGIFNFGRAVPPAAASGLPQGAAVARGSHPVQILRVIDGDTFEARVHIWPGHEITTKVRLRGIDAPELKARCDEEAAQARAARGTLTRILDEGDVTIARVSLDKYGGRVVADAATKTTADVGQAMLSAGLARKYTGARRDTWCGADSAQGAN